MTWKNYTLRGITFTLKAKVGYNSQLPAENFEFSFPPPKCMETMMVHRADNSEPHD